MKTRIKDIIFICFITTAFIYALINPYGTAYYCKGALQICANSVIPSLFIFIVLSKMISCASSFFHGKSKETFLSKIFLLPDTLIPTVICGLFLGAPSGACAVKDLYNKKLCTKNQAEIAITLCNNVSAGFIVSIAGVCLENIRLSFLLLLSNVLSVITVYFLMFRSKQVYKERSIPDYTPTKINVTKSISLSITDATLTTITLCGYILFFYTFSGILTDKLYYIFSSDVLKVFINSIFEMTSGVIACSVIEGNAKIILCAFAVSFCGLSVIFQVISVLNQTDISCKNFILSKILCGLLCPVYMIIFLLIIPRRIISVGNFNFLLNTGFTVGHLYSLMFVFIIFSFCVEIVRIIDKNNKN